MLLSQIPSGAQVMIDANIFLYAHEDDPTLGPPCEDFLRRVAQGDVEGYTATSIIAEVTHRVMCSEAIRVHGLTPRNVVATLKSQPDLVKSLTEHLTLVEHILAMNVVILSVTRDVLITSRSYRQTHGFLSNDSLTLAVMEAHGLTALATHNGDFDRVPTVPTYKPAP
ncbi:MAG: PIN domain-containing protein [Abditibacteriales bacterium]|nr:PIN domain-containing protein [Abditibacteriales bacterium]MDW8365537.1 PIN domain-containing protein [Abditibacteriales bacterium]